MLRTTFSKAMKLLADERTALRAGQLDDVVEMGTRKEELLGDLGALKLSIVEARKLRDSTAQNAKLLEAALSGVRDAQSRLAALRNVRAGLNIYDENGGRQTVARAGGGLEHKV